VRILQIDSFTDQPFHGNPAAVCLLPCNMLSACEEALQTVAREMNLSETGGRALVFCRLPC